MVHTGLSAYAGLTRAMFFKDRDKSKEKTASKPAVEKPGFVQKASVSPLGIPKSPSFHSGLDLVAAAEPPDTKRPDAAVDLAKSFRFASFTFGKEMNPPGGQPPNTTTTTTTPNGTNGKNQQNGVPNPTNQTNVEEPPDICIKTRDRNYYHTNVQDLIQLPLLRGTHTHTHTHPTQNFSNYITCIISNPFRYSPERSQRLVRAEVEAVLRSVRFCFGAIV